jgi:hypothetical protein
MTHADRVAALRGLGFSAPHATLLTHVLLHSGCLLRRQVLAASGRCDGRVTTRFLRRLVRAGRTTVRLYGRRTRLYHLRHPYLYDLIEAPAAVFRARPDVAVLVRRLMTVDTLLAFQEARVLATPADKIDYFERERGVDRRRFPARPTPPTRGGRAVARRPFLDPTPVLIEPTDERVSFVYVQGPARGLAGFRTWLEAYAPLLGALPASRVVFATVDPDGFRDRVEASFGRWQRAPQAGVAAAEQRRRLALWRYFRIRKDVDLWGAWAVSPALAGAKRRLKSALPSPPDEREYAHWREHHRLFESPDRPSPDAAAVAHVGLLVHHIRARYDVFGTFVAHSLRAPGRTVRRTPSRIDSAPSRAA